MKIFDCAPFFTEFDQLRLRMAYLDPLVDHFVVVEARRTFTGVPKPLYLSESNARDILEHPKLKIHVVDFPPTLSNWGREQYQRECIGSALKELGARKEDLILVSDVDEIPHREAVIRARDYLRTCIHPTILIFEQRLFYFRMNYELVWSRKMPWLGTVAALYGHAKSINGLRTTGRKVRGKAYLGYDREAHVFQMPEGGWHFSYLGGDEAFNRKLAAFAHQESRIQAKRGISIQSVIDNRQSLYPRRGVEEIWAVIDPAAVGIPADVLERAGVGHLFEAPHDDTHQILSRLRRHVLAKRARLGSIDLGFAGPTPWPRLTQFDAQSSR
jgi:beta-1,4-mannosyl-glycoprotein beta-1,4-N-acetylglucosaminyltransferase